MAVSFLIKLLNNKAPGKERPTGKIEEKVDLAQDRQDPIQAVLGFTIRPLACQAKGRIATEPLHERQRHTAFRRGKIVFRIQNNSTNYYCIKYLLLHSFIVKW